MRLEVTLPESVTIGDLATAAGAIVDAASMFVDWERLYSGDPHAVSTPGVVLLDVAAQLQRAAR